MRAPLEEIPHCSIHQAVREGCARAMYLLLLPLATYYTEGLFSPLFSCVQI